MKKIYVLLLIMLISLPVAAVCSITGGACSAPLNFETLNIKDKVVPNNLKNIQRTDAFQPKIIKPAETTPPHTVKLSPESGNYEIKNNSFEN